MICYWSPFINPLESQCYNSHLILYAMYSVFLFIQWCLLSHPLHKINILSAEIPSWWFSGEIGEYALHIEKNIVYQQTLPLKESALGHRSEIVELAEDIILCPRVCWGEGGSLLFKTDRGFWMFSENSGEEHLCVLFMSCMWINSSYDYNFACGFMHLIMDDAHL